MKTKPLNPIDKHVGSRVRMRRMMLGMSQEKLGDALGITFQQVQKYEKGTNRISASRLQEASFILQVPVPFFFEGSPLLKLDRYSILQPAESDGVAEFMSTRDGLALVKAFSRIRNAAIRRQVVGLVEDLAGHRAEA
jgi:transcriptional regulator with XRE-family HTH domain